ncbi:MAG: hypothetical protein K9J21_11905 [Bacteroidales bacterium]|nr:hypothetical protein [Bacteroidales bacterium]
MRKELHLNKIQLAFLTNFARENYLVGGRGVGKSSLFGLIMHMLIENMPGSSNIITTRNISHLLTSILPSALSMLERLGRIRDVHYVVGEKPPAEWGMPYEPPVKNFDNYLTFFSHPDKKPVGFHLTSQERSDSGRGFNTDFALTDESLRLKKESYDKEIIATLRANKDRFKHLPFHLGQYHSTSMPYEEQAQWILDKADYYLTDYGIDIWQIWDEVVEKQEKLLDIDEPEEFRQAWNEIEKMKQIIMPRPSKDGNVLFALGNAFDNYENVGISYIRKQREVLPRLIFMVEILNARITINKNAFYAIEDKLHVYYDSWSDDDITNLAYNSRYRLRSDDISAKQLNRKYYNPEKPLYLFMDWGGTISFALAAQFDVSTNTLHIIKEFYVLPPGEMPKRLMEQVTDFFRDHHENKMLFIRDTYGDNKSTSIQTSRTINQDAMEYLKKSNWRLKDKRHKGKEPPMFEKWQLMQKIFAGGEPFNIRIDGNNCKYLVLSLKDTKTKQVGNKLQKDKTKERQGTADQRRAPHPTDALDKGCFYLANAPRQNKSIPGMDAMH